MVENVSNSFGSFNLKPEIYFGLSRLERFSFKFINDNLIVYPTSTNLVYFNLSSGKFQSTYLNSSSSEELRNVKITKCFMFDEINLTVLELILISENELTTRKLAFVDYNFDINFVKYFVNLDQDLSITSLSLSIDKTKFALLSTNKLYFWSLESLSVISELELNGSSLDVLIYPNDSNKLLVVFDANLEGYYLDHNQVLVLNWKFTFEGSILTVKWSNSSEIFIGTSKGEIIVFNIEKQEIKALFSVWNNILTLRQEEIDDEENQIENMNFKNDNPSLCLNSIVTFSKGFVGIFGLNKIVFYNLDSMNEFKLNHLAELSINEEHSGF